MTKEELKQMLNLIVSKCDNLINNKLYTADDFTQNNVEDIAEMCNMVLDGKFGELPSLPSELDEAAKKIVIQLHPSMEYSSVLGDHLTMGELVELVKAGAEWMAGQGETLDSLIWRDEDDKLFIEAFVDENKFKMAENVTIQVRKKQ